MSKSPLQDALQGSVDEWVNSLPPYSRTSIQNLLASGKTPLEAAEEWLRAVGPTDTAPFGGAADASRLMLHNLLVEMRNVVCGGPEYESQRKEVSQAVGSGKYAIATALGVVAGPYLGAAAVVVAPAIVLILSIVVTAGQKTACQVLDELVQGSDVDSS